eukprot:365358-Chlamydomonas_euryale.AAC.1
MEVHACWGDGNGEEEIARAEVRAKHSYVVQGPHFTFFTGTRPHTFSFCGPPTSAAGTLDTP